MEFDDENGTNCISLLCYGSVKHCSLFILFYFLAAEKAKEKLDGRWFGGRRINASLFDLKKFQTGDYSN